MNLIQVASFIVLISGEKCSSASAPPRRIYHSHFSAGNKNMLQEVFFEGRAPQVTHMIT